MTTKHTPGPWSIHTNIGRKGSVGVTADAAPCIIAIMGNDKQWPVEAHNNAALIAAAPDLLAALQRVTHDLENPEKDVALNRHTISTATRQMVRESIAKAEGQQ